MMLFSVAGPGGLQKKSDFQKKTGMTAFKITPVPGTDYGEGMLPCEL